MRADGVALSLQQPLVLFLFLLLLPFYLFVVGRFFYAELGVEVVVGDGKAERVAKLREHADFGCRVDVFFLGKDELPCCGIDTEVCEDVGHVVVKHVEDVFAVGQCDLVLDLLVHGSERLCAFFGRFGCECVAEY